MHSDPIAGTADTFEPHLTAADQTSWRWVNDVMPPDVAGENMQYMEDHNRRYDEMFSESLAQKPSVPACTSFECQTDTVDPYSRKHEEVGLNPHSLNMTNNGDVVTGYSHFRDEQSKLHGLSQRNSMQVLA